MAKLAWPRFSIREFLLVTAALAVGFAWPVLLFFVAPIVAAGAFSRMGCGSATPVVVATVLSIPFGIWVSYYYWGYAFHPPQVLSETREIGQVEQLSSVGGLNGGKGELAELKAITTIPPRSALSYNTATELLATERILADFGERSVAVNSSAPLSRELLDSVWHAADEAGLLLDSEIDWATAKSLDGYIGVAQTADGSDLVFAALMGEEYTNDHYPYIEAAFEKKGDRLVLLNTQTYFVDIAGLEGLTWEPVAVAAFVVLCPVAVAYWVVWSVWRRHRRQPKPLSGPQACPPPPHPP